ncbi:MAG: hypothetical protein ACK5X3_08770 [Pseudomonadota bacterium]
MDLLREAKKYLVRQWALDPDDEDGCIREVNALSNYEFLELLSEIFNDAVREALRP